MKKITVIFLVIGIFGISAYVFLRNSLGTQGFQPKAPTDATAMSKPAASVLDLRPKLILKLQELVKQGSGGLYNLNIHGAEPDILHSTIGLSTALLEPDTAVLKQLQKANKAPAAVFKIKTDSIFIDGIGIKDILSKDVIDLKTIRIMNPVIEVFSYKKNDGQNTDRTTLYQQLKQQMKHIGIDRIIIRNGELVSHDLQKNKTTRLHDIAIDLSQVLIDSTTEYDKSRFLFAKEASLSMKNYSVPTADNLYDFKIGSIAVTATKGLLTAKNIVLQPRYTKAAFEAKVKTLKERYEFSIPSLELTNIDWWPLFTKEALVADRAEINTARASIYLDRSLPLGKQNLRNFPHQLLMKIPMKLNIRKLLIRDLDLSYEEFNPESGKSGKVAITNLHGTVTNLTNISSVIKQNPIATISASAIFMHLAPIDLTLHFDLANYKSGAFTADLAAQKGFDGTLINPVTEPIGLFRIKKGSFKKLTSHVSGNNLKASGDVLFLYDNLHVTPLKKNESKPGTLKKKSVTSFVANTFVLKDENPSKNGEQRKAPGSFNRSSGSFFNLIWKTTFTGILKTIGAPEKLAYQ
jgi:hypothetical protein